MKLQDKLIELRKVNGWSQEDFAEKLDVSRQAISRWENGTALPDAQNLLRISKLFNVTADFLLNDDYEDEAEKSVSEIVTEATEPLIRKKKKLFWYLIPLACFVILSACIIVLMIGYKNANDKLKEVHLHQALSSVKENEIAPTCTSEGSYDEVIICDDCGEEVFRNTESVAKLAHTLSESVKENEIAPTCTSVGYYDEVIYCSECGEEVLRASRSAEMIAHKYQNKKCVACGEDQPSEGLLYMSNGDGTCFVDIGECTDENIVIPAYSPNEEKVTQIKAYAFAGNSNVKSIKIPETVTVIGEAAFEDCIKLESVNLPSKLTKILPYTFNGCEKLKGVTIPAGVTYIGEKAFADCVAFESIVIPESVTKIGAFAFKSFSGGEGEVIFEVYSGWKLYDSEGNFENIVDFPDGVEPELYIIYRYCEYIWERGT